MIFIGPLVCVSGVGFEKYAFSAHDNQHRLLYQQVSRGLNFVALDHQNENKKKNKKGVEKHCEVSDFYLASRA